MDLRVRRHCRGLFLTKKRHMIMLTVLQLAILAGLTQPGQNPPLLTRPSAGAGATPGVAMGARVVLIPAHPGTADGSAVVPWPAHCSRFARDAGGGCAPAVVIAGSKKCGTNTVNEVLNVHPYATFKGQSKAGKRLIHGAGGRPFGENWFLECEIYGRGSWPAAVYGCTADGDGWANTSAYATMFDSADWKTTFGLDRSPLANVGRHAGARLMGIAPEARVILVVCEPVRRAWSGINHMVKGYAIRHNLMPSSPNEEPTAANRAEMLGVWQGLVDGILRVLERLVLPSGSAFDTLLLCAEDWPKAGWRKQKSAGPYSDASICREILLPGFYFDGLEGFVRAGFK